jgi:hypothetical protein
MLALRARRTRSRAAATSLSRLKVVLIHHSI